jgi:hypothetical protein
MAGYSGTALVKKLGLKEGMTMFVFQTPADYFDWLSPLPKNVIVKSKLNSEVDFIHSFVADAKIFQKEFVKYKTHLRKNGMLWVSWPKKSSKIPCGLDENGIRDFGLKEGLVDVKVCAINEIWSGLKFMFRIKDR